MIERNRSHWIARSARNRMSITGVAYRTDGSWLRVHMTNVSYDGCHLLTDQSLDISETVKLIMPRMQHMLAQVRWTTGEEAGVRFIQNNAVDERRARIGV